MTSMKNEELKKEMKNVIDQIRVNSKDARWADKLVDKLMSLKGQMDIEPTRLYVPEKDVIKEYDNDNLRIVRCKDCIIWQHKGGFSFVVKPTMRALYGYIDGMLAMKDKYDKLTEDEKKLYDVSYFGMSIIMQLPMYAVSDEELFVNVVEYLVERINELTDTLLNQPLQDENPKENAEFETKMEIAEELLGNGTDTDTNA